MAAEEDVRGEGLGAFAGDERDGEGELVVDLLGEEAARGVMLGFDGGAERGAEVVTVVAVEAAFLLVVLLRGREADEVFDVVANGHALDEAGVGAE